MSDIAKFAKGARAALLLCGSCAVVDAGTAKGRKGMR